MRVRRDAQHAHLLQAEAGPQPIDKELRVCGRRVSADGSQKLLHFGQPFGRRIDRAADHRPFALARAVSPQCDDQVFQFQHRPPAVDADDAAGQILEPAFRRTGQDDIARVGIEEHELNAGQAGEVTHVVGQPAAAKFLQRLFEPVERDFPQALALPSSPFMACCAATRFCWLS